MNGIEDVMAGLATTTIHGLDLNPATAAAANSIITTDSMTTVWTEPLIAANST
jgi:hypothetical protein